MQQELPHMRLNQQQVAMINLFKTPMAEEDFLQMKRLAVQLLAKKLDILVENWEEANHITKEHYEEMSGHHFRTSAKKPE